MKELVIGKGFLGKSYRDFAANEGYDVHMASRRPDKGDLTEHYVDLNNPDSIVAVLDKVQPDIIVHCAAVLGRNPGDQVEQNPVMTRNLLEGTHTVGLNLSRFVLLGSAAEYGTVEEHQLPVKEDTPLTPNYPYAQSKWEEANIAQELADKHGISLAIARVFCPLGLGLHPTNLMSRVIDQIREQKDGHDPVIEVRNLEATRDYLHKSDCVRAIGLLAHSEQLPYRIYNVASGVRTSNEEIIRAALRHSGEPNMRVVATDLTPEPVVGVSHANITRLQGLGYEPAYTVDQTVREIVEEAGLLPNQGQKAA